jgi:Bor protein
MSGIRTKMFAAALLALAVAGCSTHTIKYRNAQVAAGGQVHQERQSFFLWGLVGGKQIDLAEVCPSGVARIQDTNSFGDQLFTWVTGGLYSPRSVEIECAGGTAVLIEGVSPEQAAELVAAGEAAR